MEIEKFFESVKQLESGGKEKKEELERFNRFVERFHNLNRAYIDPETFERAKDSISSMAEMVSSTLEYLNHEIVRMRNKRMKLPFENVELNEMQKVQNRNERLIKEYLARITK